MSVADRVRARWGQLVPVAPPPTSMGPAGVSTKAAVLRRLELDVNRRLDGMLSGDHVARTMGAGTEPSGARPYGAGDDARRIDWSLTARTLELHVRTTDADRELETTVVVDRSASLDFGTARREKREVVLGAVAAFGSLTVRSGNRLGLIVAGGDRLRQVPPRPGRNSLLAALALIYDTPRLTSAPAEGADLASALRRAERTQRRRGQIIVVSDFFDHGWEAPLRRLSLRHQVIAAQVVDRRELELPPVGMLAVVDAETGHVLHVQTNDPALRSRYAAGAAARSDEIRGAIAGSGAEHVVLSTDRDWVIDVVRYIGARKPGRAVRAPVAAGHLAGQPGTW